MPSSSLYAVSDRWYWEGFITKLEYPDRVSWDGVGDDALLPNDTQQTKRRL